MKALSVAACWVAFPALVFAQPILTHNETLITTNPADQFNPAISGTRVVYTDNRNGNLDIYFTELTTGVEGRVTSSLLDEALDGISANVIVYDQYGATVSTYGYDIGTGTTFRLSAVPSVQLNPAVGANGGIAAWADNRDGNFEIYTRNMATGVVTRGTSTAADEGHPAVSPQGRVVFESCVAGSCDIQMLDPATGAVTVVANTPADERSPHIDGDSVVFDANRDGNRDIYLFNVATRIETRIMLPGIQESPHISGDFVSFQDVSSGIPHVFLYQISSGSVFQATTNPSAQFLSDISGQRIVYTDDRNGNLDVYESDFSIGPPSPPLGPPSHACVVLYFGYVYCWGNNSSGQLGPNATGTSSTSLVFSGVTNAVSVAVGAAHSCALLADGTIRCWGSNAYGQLGNGTTVNSTAPVTVAGIANAKAIAASSGNTCALLADGSVRCWGQNGFGSLGSGLATDYETMPVSVINLPSPAKGIAVGNGHACALLATGGVMCWGYNTSGQVGDGTFQNRYSPVPVSSLSNAVMLSALGSHTCALLVDGRVRCWGNNADGQLGDGTLLNRNTPVLVAGLSNATLVSAGGNFTCASASDGSARCWGNNAAGQLGNGTTAPSVVPTPVLSLPNPVVSFLGGGRSSCATLTSGELRCWGANSFGQLRDGTTIDRSTPVSALPGYTRQKTVSAGGYHTCGTTSAGLVECWGYNGYGQLGANSPAMTPQYPLSAPADAAAAGYFHSCALNGGTPSCWGYNAYGEIGDGTTTDRLSPVTLGISQVTEISPGTYHTCARSAGGAVLCWGHNGAGELGNGTTTSSLLPVPASLSVVRSVSVGAVHTCALTAGGSVYCWGLNSNHQLGNGTTASFSSTPVLVNGIGPAIAVTSGYYHSCALLADGRVACWGMNMYGQLGNGSKVDSDPGVIPNLLAVSVTAGVAHTCAVLPNGNAVCWGYDGYGQLGNGSLIDSLIPTPVSGLANIVRISAGGLNTCAITAMSYGYCWGYNSYNELGMATTPPYSSIPLYVNNFP